MKIDISTLKKTKGIGNKTIERIIEEHLKTTNNSYISKYNKAKHITPNSLVLGDMLEAMNGIKDESIDLILTDLPYGVTQNKWDSIIPLENIWSQYKRVIKENGAIILFAQGEFTHNLIATSGNIYKYDLIWEKIDPLVS